MWSSCMCVIPCVTNKWITTCPSTRALSPSQRPPWRSMLLCFKATLLTLLLSSLIYVSCKLSTFIVCHVMYVTYSACHVSYRYVMMNVCHVWCDYVSASVFQMIDALAWERWEYAWTRKDGRWKQKREEVSASRFPFFLSMSSSLSAVCESL